MDINYIKGVSAVASTFEKITRRTKKNEVLASYYEDFADDIENDVIPVYFGKYFCKEIKECKSDQMIERGNRIASCCSWWDIDYYERQGVKDVLRTFRCRDKFCDCCGGAQAKQREEKYKPFLDELEKKFAIYHIVFTVPNCEREEVCGVVDKMYKQFAYITRLFRGDVFIKGIDFLRYGYGGAVRALEITKNMKDNTFHPHFHCLFLFRSDVGSLIGEKRFVNSFSFNNCDVKRSHHKKQGFEPDRFFTSFEILLQKVWYLRYNGLHVNYSNIEELKEGYSVIAENACGHYHEVFKYATKGIFKNGEGTICNYFDFVAMFLTLYRRHIIQGYGILRGFDFESSAALDADEKYLKVIEKLKELEDPERVSEFLNTINFNLKTQKEKNIVYISRASINDLAEGD